MEWERHHTIAAIIALIVAFAFLLWYGYLGAIL